MNRTFDFSSGLPVPVPVETLAVLAERARSQGARMTVIGAVARDLVVATGVLDDLHLARCEICTGPDAI